MDIGIVCDNYKESEFLKRLTAAGLTEINVSNFGTTCKTIRVTIPTSDKKGLISSICAEVENHFTKNKNRFN